MKKLCLIAAIIFLLLIANVSQAIHTKEYQEKSSTKCDISTKESEEIKDKNENTFDMKQISILISSLSNSLELLIERFPIIEHIIQKIFYWIFYVLAINT
jgi:hypothetical protein